MKKSQRIRALPVLLRTALLVALLISILQVLSAAQTKTQTGKTFAQKLVEATHAKHPESDEIGISANTSRSCIGIASTDKSDIGGKCEKEDSEPMRTGKPVVEKEKDGFDVSLPLHDSTGEIIGAVGVGFKSAPGQTEASVTEQARKIAAEMEAQIPSKAKLLEGSE
jgi:sensor histidine kinase regulating citrate/malate metabolism